MAVYGKIGCEWRKGRLLSLFSGAVCGDRHGRVAGGGAGCDPGSQGPWCWIVPSRAPAGPVAPIPENMNKLVKFL